MILFHIVILALIQGLTEFLPISSSAHLLLPAELLGWPVQGLAFDVAVHLGTLLAVVLYFHKEVRSMAQAWSASITKKQHTLDSKLAWWIILATIPTGLVGLFGHDFIDSMLRSEEAKAANTVAWVVATTTVVFGLLLWWADAKAKQVYDEHETGWKKSLIIGCAQALALIPGTSRSGITMTAGLMLGLTREAAARYSFLMSIPVIIMAGGYETLKLIKSADALVWQELLIGAGISFVSAILCIHFFLKLLEKVGMLPFVIYRLILGAGLFFMLLTM